MGKHGQPLHRGEPQRPEFIRYQGNSAEKQEKRAVDRGHTYFDMLIPDSRRTHEQEREIGIKNDASGS